MRNPTHEQHKILSKIAKDGYVEKTGKEEDIQLYWELVRTGYLKSLVLLSGPNEWKFILSDSGNEYIGGILDNDNDEESEENDNEDEDDDTGVCYETYHCRACDDMKLTPCKLTVFADNNTTPELCPFDIGLGKGKWELQEKGK